MTIVITVVGKHQYDDDDLRKYVTKKIGHLEIYIMRRQRTDARAEVRLITTETQSKKESTCEVTVYCAHESFRARETTRNMFAATDIVEARLKNQLKKYKNEQVSRRVGVRRLLGRLSTQG